MDFDFDFRLHSDRSSLDGTQYFELVPGRDVRTPWSPAGRFVHEYTFCLFEGIFERRVPEYDHFCPVEIIKPQWNLILRDLACLGSDLLNAGEGNVSLPFGSTLNVQDAFGRDLADNQRALAALVLELHGWIRSTLTAYDCVSVFGL